MVDGDGGREGSAAGGGECYALALADSGVAADGVDRRKAVGLIDVGTRKK